MFLGGPLDGQDVRMTLRRVQPVPKKEYPLRMREFRSVQEHSFNRQLGRQWGLLILNVPVSFLPVEPASCAGLFWLGPECPVSF
jgi:hypothetical protein